MATNKPQKSSRGSMQDVTPRGKAATKPKRGKQVYTEDDIDYDYERSVKFANRGCLIATAALLLIVAVVMLWGYLFLKGELSGKNATATTAVTIDVPSASGGSIVGGLLEDNGLIGNKDIFRFYVRLSSGASFNSGRYTIEPGSSYDEIIDMMTGEDAGREVITITFPEGSSVIQIARICEEKGLFLAEEFIEAANDVDRYSDIEFFQHIDYDPETWMKAEGYLSPNTYNVYANESPESVARRLFNQFNTELNGMRFSTEQGEVGVYDMLDTLGLSLREAVTLASLVEKEASVIDENQSKVAGVFYNRLMREDLNREELPRRTLGSDVTYYYVRDFISSYYDYDYDAVPWDLKYAYLALDDPELREGLPVGPITNPGAQTLRNAMQPNGENNFYFLTDFYGNYYYAETYAGHQQNIAIMEEQNALFEAEFGEEGEE